MGFSIMNSNKWDPIARIGLTNSAGIFLPGYFRDWVNKEDFRRCIGNRDWEKAWWGIRNVGLVVFWDLTRDKR
jgi:hypothetical protein